MFSKRPLALFSAIIRERMGIRSRHCLASAASAVSSANDDRTFEPQRRYKAFERNAEMKFHSMDTNARGRHTLDPSAVPRSNSNFDPIMDDIQRAEDIRGDHNEVPVNRRRTYEQHESDENQLDERHRAIQKETFKKKVDEAVHHDRLLDRERSGVDTESIRKEHHK